MWPFKKKDPGLKLHGYDLRKWNYLGYTEAKFTLKDGTLDKNCFVHFFEHQKTYKREYKIFYPEDWQFVKEAFTKRHTFITIHAENWRIHEIGHASVVDKKSQYLENQLAVDKKEYTSGEF